MSLDNTKYLALLKIMYSPEKVQELVYQKYPLLALLQKTKTLTGGSSMDVPVILSGTNNRSADFATMRANAGDLKSEVFKITVSDNFNSAVLNHKTILSSQTDKMAFGRALDRAVKGAMQTMMRDIGYTLFRDGTGVIGQISAINTSTDVITFTDAIDLRNLEVGCRIGASANANLSSPHGGLLTITAIDRVAKTVSYTGTDTSWAQNDYVFIAGDANAKFKGLNSWLPSGSGRTAALAASFFSVTRSTDATRLGGVYYDATGKSFEDALILGESLCYDEGGSPNIIVMNTVDLAQLKIEMASRALCSNVQGVNAKISFPSIMLAGASGQLDIIGDPNCPKGIAYVLDTATWKIAHLGKDLVNTWNEDGLSMLRKGDANELYIDMYSYIQPFCEAPGFNAVIKLY